MYHASTQGNCESIRKLIIEKNYSLTEEVSKETHYWTVLHYACHYGHINVIQFLLEHLNNHKNFFEILNLQTIEGKTPLFCTILSGDIKIEKKKEIIKVLFDSNRIDLSLRKATGEDLLELAKKNQLYDFVALYCLRED